MSSHLERPGRATKDTPCYAEYLRVMEHLDRKAKQSAKAGKPTMWAYYLRMQSAVEQKFASQVEAVREALRTGVTGRDLRNVDGGIAGAALACVQHADHFCIEDMDPQRVADVWAASVYANRIHRAWGVGTNRRTLRWLRVRAGVANL